VSSADYLFGHSHLGTFLGTHGAFSARSVQKYGRKPREGDGFFDRCGLPRVVDPEHAFSERARQSAFFGIELILAMINPCTVGGNASGDVWQSIEPPRSSPSCVLPTGSERRPGRGASARRGCGEKPQVKFSFAIRATERGDVRLGGRATRPPRLRRVLLLGDESPVATHDRVRCHDARDSREVTTAEDVAFHGETASLVVGQAQSSGTVHCAENAILLDQVVNDRLLVSIDPAREQLEEEGERGRQRGHGGSLPQRRAPFNGVRDWPSCADTGLRFLRQTFLRPRRQCRLRYALAELSHTTASIPHATTCRAARKQIQTSQRRSGIA
jgi:hypothetical protein